jgi:predicted dehydrogenase
VTPRTLTRPRLGFLGAGWIGRQRMEAVVAAGLCDPVAVADPAAEGAFESLDQLLELALDGVVIATPTALHAEQAIACLDAGLAVFCQKPLGRDERETAAVVERARRADRLLGVDLTYRHSAAVERCRELVAGGEIGEVFAVEAAFHNAWAPDRAWAFDPALAGGGCVIDLGVHLVDLVRWSMGFPATRCAHARTLKRAGGLVEEYAVATLELASGAVATLACSWNLPLGRPADLRLTFYGTSGAVAVRNVGASYTALSCELWRGTERQPLVEHGEGWEGGALCAWATALAGGERYDAAVEELVVGARILDEMAGGGACRS